MSPGHYILFPWREQGFFTHTALPRKKRRREAYQAYRERNMVGREQGPREELRNSGRKLAGFSGGLGSALSHHLIMALILGHP